jgi:hypothetical protein
LDNAVLRHHVEALFQEVRRIQRLFGPKEHYSTLEHELRHMYIIIVATEAADRFPQNPVWISFNCIFQTFEIFFSQKRNANICSLKNREK